MIADFHKSPTSALAYDRSIASLVMAFVADPFRRLSCQRLAGIGVDPREKAKGYDCALLTGDLEVCDRKPVAAYLQASQPTNLPLYQRFGFETNGRIQVGSSPTINPGFALRARRIRPHAMA